MSNLPIRGTAGNNASQRQLARAERALAATELAIFKHALTTRYQAETDRLDSQAVADALAGSLDVELDLLDHGLQRAGGSQARVEIVARKVELLNNINNRRIARRFGGL